MTNKEYKKELNKLKKWADAYYKDNNPIATDEEYDILARKCLEYEKANPKKADPKSPNKIVNESVDTTVKQAHLTPMNSQKDIFDMDELEEWLTKLGSYQDIEFVTELKFDGASLNLIYVDGELDKAITRGDGVAGTSIIDNIDAISGIDKTINCKGVVEVRGEVVIHKDDFEKLNSDREEQGEVTFANARNTAAGSMRLLDSAEMLKRKLRFYVWEVKPPNTTITHIEAINLIVTKKSNFLLSPFRKQAKDMKDIMKSYNETLEKRNTYPMMIDGMIIKVNDTLLRNALGVAGKYPRGSCAYKYPAVEMGTKVIEVKGQIGRTGVYTPVAIIEPVNIDGSKVSKVTLNNFDYIKTKDIKIGDHIAIIKSGDIIPKIVNVFHDRRDGKEKEILRPEKCECGSPLIHDDVNTFCKSSTCEYRLHAQLDYFASRECMDIQHLGNKTLNLLITSGKLKMASDIYKLTRESINELGMGEKTINNILTAINSSKHKSLSVVIKSLGIDLIGETASIAIADKFGLDFEKATYNELVSIDGIGKATAKAFDEYIANNKDMITELLDFIKPTHTPKKVVSEYVMVTGTITDNGKAVKRDEIKSALEDMGYGVEKTLSKKVTLLLVGAKAGKAKIDKAKKLKIPCIDISEIEFNTLKLNTFR